MFVTPRCRLALVSATLVLTLVLGVGTAACGPGGAHRPAHRAFDGAAHGAADHAPAAHDDDHARPARVAPPRCAAALRAAERRGPQFSPTRSRQRRISRRRSRALAETQALRDKLQARWDRLTAELGRLDRETRTAIENLDDCAIGPQAAAVNVYMHNNSGGVDVALLKTVMNAKTAVDMGRDIHLIDVYGDHEQDALHQFEAAKKQLDRQVGDLSDERSQVKSDLDQATQEVADLQAAVDDASVRITASEHGIEEFQLHVVSSTSPILGPSFLTAAQLAVFITAQGYVTHITVPIEELAQMYLDEGTAAGVRGDVVFAGVDPRDLLSSNSRAVARSSSTTTTSPGIGACDTCPHGFSVSRRRQARTGRSGVADLL